VGQDFRRCDLLLVMGTSLAVAPFNSLAARPGKGVPRIFINRTRPGKMTYFSFLNLFRTFKKSLLRTKNIKPELSIRDLKSIPA